MAELLRGTKRVYKNSGSGTFEVVDGNLCITGYTYLRSYYDDNTRFTPVLRDGMTYYYDIIYSNDSGNMLYIGIEKFDEPKNPTSNDSTNYLVATTQKYDHNRVSGTMTLTNTASGTPVRYITVRILNNWSGSVTGATCGNTSKIHLLSFREVKTGTLKTTSVGKNGVTYSDSFRTTDNDLSTTKNGGAHIYNNGFMGATDFYEF